MLCVVTTLKAQDCEVVAHVMESSGEEMVGSLVLFQPGTSTRYTQLTEVDGDKGFFCGDRYYITIESIDGGECVCRYYNAGSWVQVATHTFNEDVRQLLSAVYNPADSVVYCVMQDAGTREYILQKVRIDDNTLAIEEGESMVLQRAFYALSATREGDLYGFATDAGLYRISASDGSSEKMFSTSSVGMDTQSTWIDAEGVVYRAVPSSIGTTIYSYTLDDKREKMVKVYTSVKRIVAMAANDFTIDNSKPMPVTDVIVRWEENHNNGTISFVAPGVDINGIELTDSLTVRVLVDDIEIATLRVQPLTRCQLPYVFTDGMHKIEIVASNEYGDSQEVICEVYAGYDVPQPIKRVGVTCDFPYVDVMWAEPSGEHGEAVDVDNLRYKVIRYPDCVLIADTVATSVRDSLPSMPFYYQYGVVAYLPDYETTETKSISFYYECKMQPPFSFTYWDHNIFNAFQVEDANGDGVTWEYFKTISDEFVLRYKYSGINAADDYLYFPIMQLQEDVYYEVTAYMRTGSEKYGEMFSMGLKPMNEQQGHIALLSHETVDSKHSTPYSKGFVVDESGDYRLYVHCSSPANRHILYIDSVVLTMQHITTQPQPVSDVELLTDDQQPSVVTIACMAPTTSVDGLPLDDLCEVVIYRNGEVIYTSASPIPGASITYRDSVCEIGNYDYTIVAKNTSGSSSPVTRSIVRGIATFPFSHDFADGAGFFTTIDNNNDDVTWHFYDDRFLGCMRYLSSETHAADDWLITPPIFLADSIRYQVEYSCCAGHSHYPESIRVILGRTPQPNAMSMVIDDLIEFTTISPDTCVIVPFDIPVSGVYYMAFQAISPADSYAILFRNVAVNEYDPMSVSLPMSDSCKVWGSVGSIVVDAISENDILIYHLDGRLVEKRKTKTHRQHIVIAPGMYIVCIDNVPTKVVVR